MKKILTVLIIIITIVSCDRRTPNDYSWWHSTPTVNNRTLHNYTPRPIVNRSVQRVLPNRRLVPKRIITTRSKVTPINTYSSSCSRSYSSRSSRRR